MLVISKNIFGQEFEPLLAMHWATEIDRDKNCWADRVELPLVRTGVFSLVHVLQEYERFSGTPALIFICIRLHDLQLHVLLFTGLLCLRVGNTRLCPEL
jgi:hypothetical protein